MTLSLGLNLEVLVSLPQLFNAKALSLHAELEIELATLLERFLAGVSIALDVF